MKKEGYILVAVTLVVFGIVICFMSEVTVVVYVVTMMLSLIMMTITTVWNVIGNIYILVTVFFLLIILAIYSSYRDIGENEIEEEGENEFYKKYIVRNGYISPKEYIEKNNRSNASIFIFFAGLVFLYLIHIGCR